MKVGLICPYHIFRGGGVQECVLALQAELKQRGHQAYIITPLPRDTKSTGHPNIIFLGTSTDFKSPFHTTAQISVELDTDNLNQILEKYAFDVLHFHEPWVPIMSRQLLTQSRAANVATFHAKLPETMMSKTIERVINPYTRSVMKYLHALTAVSDAAASYVRSLTDEPITIVPNGIDLHKYRFKASYQIHAAPTILYVGRLEKRKGVKYLIDAFALYVAEHPTAQLIIAGDGPDRSKLEEAVQTSHIPNVHFLGFVTEEQKHRLFDEADLFCSPAPYGESFGIVLLEAMAKGVVTLAGDNPGYASVLQGRGALSLCDPTDTTHWARQMDLLLADADLRRLWRSWARQSVRQYQYPNIVDAYEATYKQAVKAKRHGV